MRISISFGKWINGKLQSLFAQPESHLNRILFGYWSMNEEGLVPASSGRRTHSMSMTSIDTIWTDIKFGNTNKKLFVVETNTKTNLIGSMKIKLSEFFSWFSFWSHPIVFDGNFQVKIFIFRKCWSSKNRTSSWSSDCQVYP